MQISDDQARIVVREAVSSAVSETLTSLGIDVNDAIKTQAHMAAVREIADMFHDEEFKADLVHLRKWRKSMDQASNVTIKTVVGVIITGGVGLLVLGFRQWVGK